MKLTITHQFQAFLKSIGAEISLLLQRAEVPNKLWQEEISLTSLEYYRLLQEFDRVMTEEISVCSVRFLKYRCLFQPSLQLYHLHMG